MKEKAFEEILARYPELIEDNLRLNGRQLNVHGKYVDLIFTDKNMQKLVVEVKRGTVTRKDIGQIMDYEGHILSSMEESMRVMLVGNHIPKNLKTSLDYHGIEWREILLGKLISFLQSKEDHNMLKIIKGEMSSSPSITPSLYKIMGSERLDSKTDSELHASEIDGEEKDAYRDSTIRIRAREKMKGVEISEERKKVLISINEAKRRHYAKRNQNPGRDIDGEKEHAKTEYQDKLRKAGLTETEFKTEARAAGIFDSKLNKKKYK
jgi:hypothetical protein